MNNQKIKGIVVDFLEGNAASEIIPCIFQVTTAAVSTENNLTENQRQKMCSLLVFVLKLDQEVNAPEKINRESFKQYLDPIFKELESAFYNLGVLLNDNESFELMKRIRKFEADYNELIKFINENVKA